MSLHRYCLLGLRTCSLNMRWTIRLGVLGLVAGVIFLIFYFTIDGRYGDISQLSLKKRYITADFHNEKNLGNLMFHYASLVGIAKTNNFTPVLFPEPPFELHQMFHVPMLYLRYQDRNLLKAGEFYEKEHSVYDNRTESLHKLFPGNVALAGYYQSWKYFRNVEGDLRENFIFLPHLKRAVKDFFINTVPRHWWKHPRVGIHIQRSSILTADHSQWGYTAAPAEYFHKAINYFMDTLGRRVLFVVCGDDMDWAKKHIKPLHVVYSEGSDDHTDFAILAFMHHNIMSTGAFGWWSSWLANGTTIYYKDAAKPDSHLAQGLSNEDHFPAHWLPM